MDPIPVRTYHLPTTDKKIPKIPKEEQNCKKLRPKSHPPSKPHNECNPAPPPHGEELSAEWNLPQEIIFIA